MEAEHLSILGDDQGLAEPLPSADEVLEPQHCPLRHDRNALHQGVHPRDLEALDNRLFCDPLDTDLTRLNDIEGIRIRVLLVDVVLGWEYMKLHVALHLY